MYDCYRRKECFEYVWKTETNSSNGMNLFDSLFLQIEIVFIGQISPSERNLLVGFLQLVGAYNLESGGEGSLKFNLLKFSRKSRETLTTFFE